MAKHVLNKARTTTWEITKSGDTWILGDKGKITGTDMFGIHAGGVIDAATVKVNGVIDVKGPASSGVIGAIGVFLESARGVISVSKDARIYGEVAALGYFNLVGKVSIDNDGLLKAGDFGIAVRAAPHNADIVNDGRILAVKTGIAVAGAGADITNSGIIRAENAIVLSVDGVIGNPPAADAAHIVNTGRITGSSASIIADDVAVNIRNKGLLSGDVMLAAGDDVFNNKGGTVYGDIYGGEGGDIFNMAGGKVYGVIYGGLGDDVVTLGLLASTYVELANEGLDTVRVNSGYVLGENIENLTLLGKGNHFGTGNDLNNVLTGNRGANTLYGHEGSDTLDGGAGNDRMAGGLGLDVFVFKPGNGRDTITDFADMGDKIDLTAYGLSDFTDLDGKISQVGEDVVIAFSNADRLIIRNMDEANIDGSDFTF